MALKSAEALSTYIKNLQAGDARNVIVYFVGTRTDGRSWCPDCVNSDPMVLTAIQSLDARKAEFLEVEVGDRVEWRSHDNEFKKWFNITNIPTLIIYNDTGNEERRSADLNTQNKVETFLMDMLSPNKLNALED